MACRRVRSLSRWAFLFLLPVCTRHDPRRVQCTARLEAGEPEESKRSVLSHEMLEEPGWSLSILMDQENGCFSGGAWYFKICFFIRIFKTWSDQLSCSFGSCVFCKCPRELSGNTLSTLQQVMSVRYPRPHKHLGSRSSAAATALPSHSS